MKIEVCSVCKSPKCDGKEYQYKDKENDKQLIKLCTSKVFMVKGKLNAHFIMGHGCEWDEEVELRQ